MRRLLPLFLCLLTVLPVSAQTQEEEAGRYLETMIGAIREGNADVVEYRMATTLIVSFGTCFDTRYRQTS